jgi:hypothetical protein
MDGETCIDCLPEIKKCESNIQYIFISLDGRIVELKPGYWRKDRQSRDIYICLNKESNCISSQLEIGFKCLEGIFILS